MDNPKKIQSSFELLTVDEYAKRLQVGRTTIYEWKSSGKLIPQQHFIQKGRVIRFIWELETIRSLHENDTPDFENSEPESTYEAEKGKYSSRKSTIDLNY
jgi:excisionase family DNA binding protein